MVHQIVDFKITVYYCSPISRSGFRVLKKSDHLVEVWDLADGLMRLNVDSFGLGVGDGGESLELPVVEA